MADRIFDSSTPEEIRYFTPGIVSSQSIEAVSNQQQYLPCVNNFAQEDPFVGAIATSLDEPDAIKTIVTTGLVCELKTYEVCYNSRGQISIIAIEVANS